MKKKCQRSYIALYGNVALEKGYCPDCGSYAFVEKGILTCCDKILKDRPNTMEYVRECIPEQARRKPSAKQRNKQLEEQDYRCFYCGRSIGSFVFRGDKAIMLRIHWDHLVPYALTQNNNNSNFVAACHICNLFKSSHVFQTVEEAQVYLAEKWEAKGYKNKPPDIAD